MITTWKDCLAYPECVSPKYIELLNLAQEIYPMKEEEGDRYVKISRWLESWATGTELMNVRYAIAPHM